jgi:hypothetical protein
MNVPLSVERTWYTKEMGNTDVQGKREAAGRWPNRVSIDKKFATSGPYLLVSGSDVKAAKGTWDTLKGLGGL